MSFKLEEGFTVISRDGQIGIYLGTVHPDKYPFREEAEIVAMDNPPDFSWDLKGLGVLRESDFNTISMLYPKYFNEEALATAYRAARRDGLAVVNIDQNPDEHWR